jgi:heme/copper-type cytochrome/quinol oxidase subunit 3
LSGATCTWSHNAILVGNRNKSLFSLGLTVFLGFFFTFLQLIEYIETNFTISDGIYGSVFFLSTGFHGFHVIIGSIFLLICFLRLYNHHFTTCHHFGFEAAAWYWHFVGASVRI